ncbi:glycosyltransferase family 4 protein [Pseudactinotalea sp. Z1748]|uniref:glycosyltransferase family 4 protein n=1 Tax=Pseudactinotalea sp. Z1748 TaxID=3413027 RepID=UPI003C7E53F7
MQHIHLITPGDHFSPRTGSAIPTVVHGLAGAACPTGVRPAVLLARGTYPDRYQSAEIIEFDQAPARRFDGHLDVIAGRLGVRRPSRRTYAASLRSQRRWEQATLLAHNAPQAIPLVDPRHQAVLYAHNQLLRTYSRRESGRTLDAAAAIICVSEHLAQQTADLLPQHLRPRVRVVHNGVDTAFFSEVRHPRADRLRVGFLGRVIPGKGVHVLLEAVNSLARPDIEVTVIGRPGFAADAPLSRYERKLRKLAAVSTAAVSFASFLPRQTLPAALSDVDVLVVPSVWPEPFGLTALEGMAAGAAVIASDVGGLPEAVGAAGMLVPPGDVTSLAAALAALADDPGLLASTQDAGGDRARTMTWAHSRESLERVLAGI